MIWDKPLGFNKQLMIELKIMIKETGIMTETMEKITNVNDAEQKALGLYNKHFNLKTAIRNNDFATDLYNLLQILNIDIMIHSLNELKAFEELKKLTGKTDIEGFLLRDDDEYTIVVEESASMAQKRFTIAHEIAHKMLNHLCDDDRISISYKSSLESDEPEEQAANAFAKVLLMPEIVLRHVFTITKDVTRIAESLGVSTSMLKERLNTLEIL